MENVGTTDGEDEVDVVHDEESLILHLCGDDDGDGGDEDSDDDDDDGGDDDGDGGDDDGDDDNYVDGDRGNIIIAIIIEMKK